MAHALNSRVHAEANKFEQKLKTGLHLPFRKDEMGKTEQEDRCAVGRKRSGWTALVEGTLQDLPHLLLVFLAFA